MKKSLQRKTANNAEENTSVTLKSGREEPKVLKSGQPLDHAVKHVNDNKRFAERQIIGVSKGVTLNMGEFQSLRIDCWLTDAVKEHETVDQAFQRVGAIIDEQLYIQRDSINL